jgi:GNAT superfamily N-acetyltransferase
MLRRTIPTDTPALLTLTKGTGVFQDHEIETLEEVFSDFHREGDSYGHVCLTREEDGQPIGFVYFAPVAMTDRTWELWWIVVGKKQQGHGTGRRLLEQVEQFITDEAGRLLLIETSSTPHYEATRRFYLQNGYILAAQLADFYHDGDDKCVYSKRLIRRVS